MTNTMAVVVTSKTKTTSRMIAKNKT
jgi:hypothetical protein